MSVTDAREEGQPPRVLHLIPSLEIGGTEGQLLQYIERSGAPERHVIAVSRRSGASRRGRRLGHLIELEMGHDLADVGANLRALSTFHRSVRRLGAEIVHAHLEMSELIAFLATPPGVPIVASRRGPKGRYESRPAYRRIEGIVHRRSRVLICNSRYLAEQVRAEDHSPPPVVVIYNAVDTEHFDVAPFPRGRPTVTVVANMQHAYKGHARMLQAMRVVHGELPDAQLVLVGDGAERADLERLTQQLGLLDAVTFTGSVDDIRPHVRQAHVAALTSDEEGFPNALLEAMAMGRPVVATRVGGVPELVRDGVDGWLTTLDANDIARRVLDLLRDRATGDRLGAAARSRAEAFGWERLLLETEAVYRRVVGRPN